MLQWGNTPSSRHCIRFSRGPGVLLTPCDAGSGRLPSGRCAPPSFAFGPCRPRTFRRVAWGLHAVASFAGPRSSPLRALALLRSSPLAQRLGGPPWRHQPLVQPSRHLGATANRSYCQFTTNATRVACWRLPGQHADAVGPNPRPAAPLVFERCGLLKNQEHEHSD